MKKILFIHQAAELYGSDKTLLYLLNHLNREKFLPVVIVPYNGKLVEELKKKNIKVYISPILKLHRNVFKPLNFLKFIKEFVFAFYNLIKINRKYQFDIIYSNTLAVLIGALFSRAYKIKHIWHVHEIIEHPKSIANLYPKLLNGFANSIVCNSNSTKNNLIKRLVALNKKTTVIHNGLYHLNEINFSKETKESNTSLTFGIIGRISHLKGHKFLIKTLKNNLSKYNYKLLIVGSPVPKQEAYLEDVKQLINSPLLQNKIEIIPFQQDLSLIWQKIDVLIVPSIEPESFGLVAVEAMLAKKPVIGSNHGGLTEIIVHEETGLLFKPNSEEALAHAIIDLINHPEKRKSFGEKGYKRAINEFSIDKYVDSFEQIFEEL